MLAEVNDTGEVTVEGQFVGRLEGFQFRQDPSAEPGEAKTLRTAAMAALKPEFHLRSDRFYNAPDTEIDFTEQGGLMWGEHAVGKLVKGGETLKPQAQAFVDDEAGADIAQKVQRRLQHFIDRKVAMLFEPLLAMQKDEGLTPAARGFAFRLGETLGIVKREDVADEVKALDQETRGLLRKHGVRFGQYTIFMPALLKPAPTRLRLLLWSLGQSLDEFPSAPPPGLVTIPIVDVPEGCYTMSGYRRAGVRAIRIDMLERLADMLRTQDSKAGFEASADMLSITGMTLEQFADLMGGLGYGAEKGEREKQRAAVEPAPAPEPADPNAPPPNPITEEESVLAPKPAEDEAAQEPVIETFFVFRWVGMPRPKREGGRRPDRARGKPPARDQKPGGRPPKGKKGKPGPREDKADKFSARPPRKEKPIDPDNPFAAALMGLKGKI